MPWTCQSRVSGLEGGGRELEQSAGGREALSFPAKREKKTSAHSLTSYLHIHSCLALYFGLFARTFDCLSAQIVLEDSGLEAGLLAERWFSFSSLDQLQDFLSL